MKKEPDGNTGKFLTNQARHLHQLVVMNPQDIILAQDRKQLVRKHVVDMLIAFERLHIKLDEVWEVMKQARNRGIAESVIKSIVDFCLDKDRNNVKRGCRCLRILKKLLPACFRKIRRPYPQHR